jgi:hypothetical protein
MCICLIIILYTKRFLNMCYIYLRIMFTSKMLFFQIFIFLEMILWCMIEFRNIFIFLEISKIHKNGSPSLTKMYSKFWSLTLRIKFNNFKFANYDKTW